MGKTRKKTIRCRGQLVRENAFVSPGFEPRTFACKANVITNYTMKTACRDIDRQIITRIRCSN